MNLKIVLGIFVALVMLTGCVTPQQQPADGSTDPETTNQATPTNSNSNQNNNSNEPKESATVTIDNMTFVDGNVTIKKGGTITWLNDELLGHIIVADDGSYTSRVLSKSDSFSHTFTTAGTFKYHCGLHSGMTGTITVVE